MDAWPCWIRTAVSDRSRRPRPGARALRRGPRPAADHAARPYRPALVRRGRAFPRPGPALRRARPLRLPDALLAGRAAHRARRPTRRRRPDRDRRPPDLAPLRRELPLLRGTPSRIWLDHTFETVFGLDSCLSAATADAAYDHIADCLARPEYRPARSSSVSTSRRSPPPTARSTTCAGTRTIRASGWDGQVVPAYRPDAVVDPEFAASPRTSPASASSGLRHAPGRATSRRTASAAPSSSPSAPPAPTTAIPPPAPPTSPRPRPRRSSPGRSPARRRPRTPTLSAARC